MRPARYAAACTAATIVALLACPVAQSDDTGDNDADFITALQNKGFALQDGATAVRIGHQMCDVLDSHDGDIPYVVRALKLSDPTYGDSAMDLVITSAVHYCPHWLPT